MKKGKPIGRLGIPPFRALLVGPPGTGKTTSLNTLSDAGLKVRIVCTDPGAGVLDLSKVVYHYKPYAAARWDVLKVVAGYAKTLNEAGLKALQRVTGENQEFSEFIELLETLSSYVNPQTGEELGDTTMWGTDTVLALDGLTGLSKSSRYLVAGAKPSLSQPEWGSAMHHISMLLDVCTLELGCHFVLIAHAEYERDEYTGQAFQTVATLGRKLGPLIPVNFNDVILAWEDKGEYGWATTAEGWSLKHMYLPSSPNLKPSFVPLVEEWIRRGGVISPEPWRG